MDFQNLGNKFYLSGIIWDTVVVFTLDQDKSQYNGNKDKDEECLFSENSIETPTQSYF